MTSSIIFVKGVQNLTYLSNKFTVKALRFKLSFKVMRMVNGRIFGLSLKMSFVSFYQGPNISRIFYIYFKTYFFKFQSQSYIFLQSLFIFFYNSFQHQIVKHQEGFNVSMSGSNLHFFFQKIYLNYNQFAVQHLKCVFVSLFVSCLNKTRYKMPC